VQHRWSPNNANSSCLGFRSPEDALNFASEIAQNGKDWLASKRLDIAKSYSKGHVDIVVHCCMSNHPGDYDFVFSSVPRRGMVVKDSLVKITPSNKLRLSDINSRMNDGSVLVGITNLVESPQGRIPSFVRFEPHKDRLDFIQHVLGLGFEVVEKLPSCISKREGSAIHVFPRDNGTGTMIQSRSQILNGRNSEFGDSRRKSACEFDLVEHVNTLSIKLGDSFVRVRRKKQGHLKFEFLNIFLCPSDSFNGSGKLSGNRKSLMGH